MFTEEWPKNGLKRLGIFPRNSENKGSRNN